MPSADESARKWREGKVRPLPGNSPHDRAGKPWGSSIVKENLRTIPSLPLHFNEQYWGAPVCVFKAGRNLSVRCGQTKTKSWGGGRSPPVGRPPGPGKRTRREDHALLIVRDEFRAGYSLIGLLASRARRRFTGTARINYGRKTENGISSNGNGVFSPVSHEWGSPHHPRLSAFIGG